VFKVLGWALKIAEFAHSVGLSFTEVDDGMDDGVDRFSVSLVGIFNSFPEWSTQSTNRIRTPMATPAFKTPPSAFIPKRKALNTGASHPQ
jgi:hypothetical protein